MEREEALNQEKYALADYSKNIRELLEDKIALSEKVVDKILSFPSIL